MAFGNFGDEPKPHIGSDFTINQYENASANYQKYSGNSAVGSIEVKSTPDAGETVSITSAAGTTKTYVFLEDGVDSTGTVDGGSVVVQLDGVSGVGNIAAQLQTAINHANGHNGGSANSVISISRTDGVLTLTQVVGGPDGNKTISYSAAASQVTATSFSGGTIAGALDQIPFSLGLSGVLPFNIGSAASRSGYTMTKGKQVSTE
jgi:hypothetical protein